MRIAPRGLSRHCDLSGYLASEHKVHGWSARCAKACGAHGCRPRGRSRDDVHHTKATIVRVAVLPLTRSATTGLPFAAAPLARRCAVRRLEARRGLWAPSTFPGRV